MAGNGRRLIHINLAQREAKASLYDFVLKDFGIWERSEDGGLGRHMLAEMTHHEQVDTNFAAFQKLLPELIGSHPGKFAVLNDGKIADFFDTIGDAAKFGRARFGTAFSIQEVTSRNVNLGYYSHAVQHLPH